MLGAPDTTIDGGSDVTLTGGGANVILAVDIPATSATIRDIAFATTKTFAIGSKADGTTVRDTRIGAAFGSNGAVAPNDGIGFEGAEPGKTFAGPNPFVDIGPGARVLRHEMRTGVVLGHELVPRPVHVEMIWRATGAGDCF